MTSERTSSLATLAGQATPETESPLVDEVTDGFLHLARDWTITFARIGTGHRRRIHEEMVGQRIWDVFPGLAGSRFETEFRNAMENRVAARFEAHYAPADIWFEDHLFPTGDGLALFYRNINARRIVEAQLDARNRQQATLAELGQSALAMNLDRFLENALQRSVAALDAHVGGLYELNPERTGFKVRAAIGLPPNRTDPLPNTGLAGYAVRSRAPVIVPDYDSDHRFAHTPLAHQIGIRSGMTVPLLHGQPWGAITVFSQETRAYTQQDIDFLQSVANLIAHAIARHSIEEELRNHQANLEKEVEDRTYALAYSNRELEAFAYTVSHDLRAPLRTIASFSDILAARPSVKQDESAKKALHQIQQGALGMGRLIEALMELSRVSRTPLTRQSVDLSDVARAELEKLAAQEPHRKVEIIVEPGLATEGDAALLRVALSNLLSNAWKFSRDQPRARIEVKRCPGTGLTFSVSDNGSGFDAKHAGRLFEPFQRLHGNEVEGTGVGLATVQRIVHRHDGRVWAEATPGAGATFFVTLPARADDGERDPRTNQEANP